MSATATLETFKTGGVLPQSFARNIIGRVSEGSVVQKLAGTTPIPITGTTISVQTSQPQAGVVGEGQAKPVTNIGVTAKTIKPIKVAALMYWSMEARQADQSGYLKLLEKEAAAAITRAFDLAILHGKNAINGQTIAGVEYINQTANRIELGATAKDKGGLTSELLAGADLVNLNENFDFDLDGFAADKSFKSRIYGATDTLGRPIYSDSVNLKDNLGNLLGLPVAYGRAVSGKVGASADTKVRAFGGDWSALKYGFAEKISIRRTDQATINDGGTQVNLWQNNMEAMLVEAQFGWVITDKSAFVAYEDKVTDPK